MKYASFAILLIAISIVSTQGSAQNVTENGLHDKRERIATARRDAESRYRQEEAACYQRFAVNDCLKEADARRRAVRTDLRHQENALNDLERKRRPPRAKPGVPAESLAPTVPPAHMVPQPAAPAASRPEAAAGPADKPAPREGRSVSRQARDAKATERAKVARDKAQESRAKKQRIARRKQGEKVPVPGLPRPS